MKSKVNLKVLEKSLSLASKASDLERACEDEEIAELLHEVNLMALGIPKVITEAGMDTGMIAIKEAIDSIKAKIAKVPIQSEAIFEFARLLDEESDLVNHYKPDRHTIIKPVKKSRLSLKDRGRTIKPLHLRAGFQTSLF